MDVGLHDQKARDSSLKKLTDPDFICCHASNRGQMYQLYWIPAWGKSGSNQTLFYARLSLATFKGKNALHWSWGRPSHGCHRTRLLAAGCSSRYPGHGYHPTRWSTGSRGSPSHGDQHIEAPGGHSTQLLQLAVLDGSRDMQDPEQPVTQQGGGVKFDILPGQPTTFSCPLKNLWQKLVSCIWKPTCPWMANTEADTTNQLHGHGTWQEDSYHLGYGLAWTSQAAWDDQGWL